MRSLAPLLLLLALFGAAWWLLRGESTEPEDAGGTRAEDPEGGDPLTLVGRGASFEGRGRDDKIGGFVVRRGPDLTPLGDDDPPVEIVVLDDEGKPVPRARVVVTGRLLGTRFEPELEGPLLLGRRWLRDGGELRVESAMDRDGKAMALRPRILPLRESDVRRLDLRLEPSRDLEVRVVDESGAPVAATSVHVTSPDPASDTRALFWNTSTWANTDANGVAQFVRLPRVDLVAAVEGDVEETTPRGRVEVGPTRLQVDLVLPLGTAIEGVVVYDGRHVAEMAVEARGWDRGEPARWNARTDRTGAFRIRGVPDGVDVAIEAVPADTEHVRSNVATGIRAGARNVVVTIEAAVSIGGRVVDRHGKTPAEGWRVEAVPLDEGNEHGRLVEGWSKEPEFVLRGLRRGRYRVEASTRSGSHSARPVEVTAPTDGLRLAVEPAPRVHGVVEGVRGARYDAWWTTPTTKASARVNPDGTFEIPGVPDEAGTLYVGSLSTDRYALRTNVRPSDRPQELTLSAGQRISGRIDLEEGAHPGLVYVVLSGEGFELWEEMAKDGTFQVLGVPPGSYEVSLAVNETRGPTLQRVQAGATGVVLAYARAP